MNVNEISDAIHTLHYAVRGDNFDIVKYLVEQKGCDVNALDNVNGTPLHDAAYRGNLKIARYLLQHGANAEARNKLNHKAIDDAREKHHTDVVQCLESIQACISSRQRRSIEDHIGQSVEYSIDARQTGLNGMPPRGIVNADGLLTIADLVARKVSGVQRSEVAAIRTEQDRQREQIEESLASLNQALNKTFIQ